MLNSYLSYLRNIEYTGMGVVFQISCQCLITWQVLKFFLLMVEINIFAM